MKSVLASFKPQYIELIASGRKTVEFRKTRPKLDTPFKVYIYQTKTVYISKSKENDLLVPIKQNMGKVIGEFVCDRIDTYTAEFVDDDCYEDIRYHYVDCELDEQELIVTSNCEDNPSNCALCEESCLTFDRLKHYIGVCFHDKPFYAWHISDLVIYDNPKELSEFRQCHKCEYYFNCKQGEYSCNGIYKLTRPPQSWCYVEEVQND